MTDALVDETAEALRAQYFGSVRNGTDWLRFRCHDWCMRSKKRKKEVETAVRASVTKEMAKPRVSKSARIAERNLDASRIFEGPRTIQPESVEKIILASRSK
jgi:hypothetical protein